MMQNRSNLQVVLMFFILTFSLIGILCTFYDSPGTVSVIDHFTNANEFLAKKYYQIRGLPIPPELICPTCPVCPVCPVISNADKDPRCAEWAKRSECTNTPGYMILNCATSCASFIKTQPPPTYKYASLLGDYNMPPWNLSSTKLGTSAFWIWNNADAAKSAPGNEYIWFYHVFYNFHPWGVSMTLPNIEVHAATDNFGTLYVNDDKIGIDISGGWPDKFTRNSSFFIKSGFNYVRVCAFNQGGPAGLYVSFNMIWFGMVFSAQSWLTTVTKAYKENPQPPAEAFFVYLAVKTDNRLYVKREKEEAWRPVATDTRGDLIAVSTCCDGRMILGITKENKIILKSSWSSSNWTDVTSGSFHALSVTMGKDGRLFAIGTDRNLWTTKSLFDLNWTSMLTKSAKDSLRSVVVGDNAVYATDFTNKIWLRRRTDVKTIITDDWSFTGENSCCVIGLSVRQDMKTICVGTDNQIYEISSIAVIGKEAWTGPVKNSGPILSVCMPISYGDLL